MAWSLDDYFSFLNFPLGSSYNVHNIDNIIFNYFIIHAQLSGVILLDYARRRPIHLVLSKTYVLKSWKFYLSPELDTSEEPYVLFKSATSVIASALFLV